MRGVTGGGKGTSPRLNLATFFQITSEKRSMAAVVRISNLWWLTATDNFTAKKLGKISDKAKARKLLGY